MAGALLAVQAGSRGALGQPLPRYDVDGGCIRQYGSLVPTCVLMQQQAYNDLRGPWNKVPADIRRDCIEIAGQLGGQYQSLVACVESRLEAWLATQPRHFEP